MRQRLGETLLQTSTHIGALFKGTGLTIEAQALLDRPAGTQTEQAIDKARRLGHCRNLDHAIGQQHDGRLKILRIAIGFAQRAQSHDLVFVFVELEPKILGDQRIEHSQRLVDRIAIQPTLLAVGDMVD